MLACNIISMTQGQPLLALSNATAVIDSDARLLLCHLLYMSRGSRVLAGG
jgi:hypothetical protein